MQDNRTLADYNIQMGSIVHLVLILDMSGNNQIFIETLTGKKFSLDVKPSETIKNIKAKIQDREGIPAEKQKLVFAGRILEDNTTLADYNIEMESIVYLIIKV